MTAIKQLSIKEPRVQALETYIITNDDFGKSAPLYVFIPISQPYGKNPKWIQYSTTTHSFATFYFNAKELEYEIVKFSDYGGNKMKLYVMSTDWGESLPFKLMNEKELQSQLVNATTMQGRRTSTPRAPRTLRTPVKKTSVKTHAKRR